MSETTIYRQYRKSLLPPERVRELSRLRPSRAVVDTLLCWAVIVAMWALVAWKPTWWMVLLAIPVVGTRSYALMIIAHDGLHRRLFPGVKANDWFNDLFVVGSFGAITRINNRNHLSHHNHLATEEDPDRHKYTCLNKDTGFKLISYLIGGQVLLSIWNVLAPGTKLAKTPAKDKVSRTLRDLLILVGWQALLWTTLTYFIAWWAVPVLWYMPFFVFALLGDNFRTFAEHTQPEPDEHGDTHRLITYDSNPIERMFFSPMNMNYHTCHHLWTSIPYYNLPQADAEIRHLPAAAGLEWRTSYVGFLVRYWFLFAHRRVQGRTHMTPAPEFADKPLIESDEVPRCPVCGHDHFTDFARGYDYESLTCRNEWRFVQCASCGHVWLNPRPAISTLGVIYPPTYYAYNYQSQINSIALRGKQWLDRSKMKSIIKRLPREPKSYVDVGCGDGRFLRAMHARGLEKTNVYGLELDEKVIAPLHAEGYKAYCRRVEDCTEIADNSIDLATMFHVIEHVDDPAAVVRKVASWLTPGGVFAVETPSVDSLDARTFKPGFWGGYHIPRHWNLFSPPTLKRLFEDNGLRVIHTSFQTGHSFWMYSMQHSLNFGKKPHKKMAQWFNPLKGLPMLIGFTAWDKLRATVGAKTSAMLMLAQRQG